jgi:hypothetical protein
VEWQPSYQAYAELLNKHNVGAFFWSLMLKPAYLPGQRRKAVLNGLFHEDGAVWSLEDARAISGNAAFHATERKEWPTWAKIIPEVYGRGGAVSTLINDPPRSATERRHRQGT